MNDMTYFDRLVASTRRIARHSWHPGKQAAIELAVEDVEGLVLSGRITEEQGQMLKEVLMGARINAA